MKTVRWILGALVLLGILLVVILYATDGAFLPSDRAHSGFFARALYIVILSALMVLFRILKGPTPADRIVGVDILGILVVGLCAILALATDRSWYLDIGIAWGLQSFIGTLALAKFMEGRTFDD
ncbi:MAG: cation:proton antiporter [Candidatus Fermentibacteraceae bacterium]